MNEKTKNYYVNIDEITNIDDVKEIAHFFKNELKNLVENTIKSNQLFSTMMEKELKNNYPFPLN